jgi:SAM-dependent methyltransferase
MFSGMLIFLPQYAKFNLIAAGYQSGNTTTMGRMSIDHDALADRDHRSYVGPARHYDFLGASQFRLLCTLGLRADHKVMDFGCGSLRAGRLLIPYLDRGSYFGVEPNDWLVTEGIAQEIGQDLVSLKQPQFSNNENFEVAEFDQCFDFILAQSIFSHTGRNLVELALANFSLALAPGGLIAATFINGVDYAGEGWIYPKCATFEPATVQEIAATNGLLALEIPWYHPRQSWWLFAQERDSLPTAPELELLHGAVLRDADLKASHAGLERLKKRYSRWYKYRVLARIRRFLNRSGGKGKGQRGV